MAAICSFAGLARPFKGVAFVYLSILNSVLVASASLFGVGRLKPGPGTWGTLVTLPFVVFLAQGGPLVYMVGALITVFYAIFAAQAYEKHKGQHDSSEVVIDEFCGYLIAMTWIPLTWQSFVLSFVLFRLLDIFKPFPIGWLDKKVQGGLGVVVDDVAAGLLVNIVLQFLLTHTNWLGVRLYTL